MMKILPLASLGLALSLAPQDTDAQTHAVYDVKTGSLTAQQSARPSLEAAQTLQALGFDEEDTQGTATVLDTSLVLEDFANGFEGWEVEAVSPATVTDELWKYATELQLQGTFTGFVNDEGVGFDSVLSASVANGYAVANIDEDLFRGEGEPGAVPAVEQWLTSPAYDLSGLPESVYQLSFYALQRFCCNADANNGAVSFSSDNGETWSEPVLINEDLDVNARSGGMRTVRIPTEVSASAEARFRFIYQGAFYYLAIDDISVVTNPEINIRLQENFYASAPTYGIPTYHGNDSLTFLVDVRNLGLATDTFFVLAEVYTIDESGPRLGDVIFEDSLEYIVAFDSLAENQVIATYGLPRDIGRYAAVYTVLNRDNEGEDADPSDNRIIELFEVTESTYESGSEIDGYSVLTAFANDQSNQQTFGSVFVTPQDPGGRQLDSVQFSVSTARIDSADIDQVELEIQLYGIYGDLNGDGLMNEASDTAEAEFELLGTNFFELDESFVEGSPIITRAPIELDREQSAFVFPEDFPYPYFGIGIEVPSVGGEDFQTGPTVFTGLIADRPASEFARQQAGDSAFVNGFVRTDFGAGSSFSFNAQNVLPYVVAYLSGDSIVSTTSPFAEEEISVYPNPAQTEVSIQYDFGRVLQSVAVTVTDALGRTRHESVLREASEGQISIDVSTLNRGLYYIDFVSSEGQRSTRRVMIER